jgi:hypothetical protein
MRGWIFFLLPVSITACSVANYNADKKYSKETLRSDYTLLRNILEKKTPFSVLVYIQRQYGLLF